MSKTEKVLGVGVLIAIVIAVGALLQSAGGVNAGAVSPNDSASTNFTQLTASNGLAVGTSQQFQVDANGNIATAGSGTTTVGVTTTSTTKGVCFNLIATSSATAINMTFAASTTAASTVGIAPILRYGVCP